MFVRPTFQLIGVFFKVIKSMRLIPAISGSAHRFVNSASGFVTNHTSMGLLRERTTCVG
jgi:hypothetical protein